MSGATKQGTTITMPKLGESVTEGTLGAWLKNVGDSVDKYEPMVEVVTDKVTAEIPAPVSGTIVEIIGQDGDTIPVGGLICVIDEGNGVSASVAPPVDEQPQASMPEADSTTPTADTLPTSGPSGGSGQVVDLTDADDDGNAFGVHRHCARLQACSIPRERRSRAFRPLIPSHA